MQALFTTMMTACWILHTTTAFPSAPVVPLIRRASELTLPLDLESGDSFFWQSVLTNFYSHSQLFFSLSFSVRKSIWKFECAVVCFTQFRVFFCLIPGILMCNVTNSNIWVWNMFQRSLDHFLHVLKRPLISQSVIYKHTTTNVKTFWCWSGSEIEHRLWGAVEPVFAFKEWSKLGDAFSWENVKCNCMDALKTSVGRHTNFGSYSINRLIIFNLNVSCIFFKIRLSFVLIDLQFPIVVP